MKSQYLGTVAFIVSLIILLSLSYWQIHRLQWKNIIIDQLTIEYQKNTAQNQFDFKTLMSFKKDALPLRYGKILGHFDNNKTIFLGPKPYDSQIGYHVLTPFKLKEGSVLVNRGWIKENKILKLDESPKLITVSGIFRKPDWNSFTPDNSPENNIWIKPDIEEIADIKKIDPIAPVILYADSKTSSIIIPQDQKWYPRNKHLQYAIFWFTMALALSAVFGIFLLKSKKS